MEKLTGSVGWRSWKAYSSLHTPGATTEMYVRRVSVRSVIAFSERPVRTHGCAIYWAPAQRKARPTGQKLWVVSIKVGVRLEEKFFGKESPGRKKMKTIGRICKRAIRDCFRKPAKELSEGQIRAEPI